MVVAVSAFILTLVSTENAFSQTESSTNGNTSSFSPP